MLVLDILIFDDLSLTIYGVFAIIRHEVDDHLNTGLAQHSKLIRLENAGSGDGTAHCPIVIRLVYARGFVELSDLFWFHCYFIPSFLFSERSLIASSNRRFRVSGLFAVTNQPTYCFL